MSLVNDNFKFLYKYYHDKQAILAKEFHVPQSNISAYVNGKKEIPVDILEKISIYYNVSTDDLINKDLSLTYTEPQVLILTDVISFMSHWLPMLTSTQSNNNPCFNTAYRIISSVFNPENLKSAKHKISTADLVQVVSLFQDAWHESNDYAALANSISTILFLYLRFGQFEKEYSKTVEQQILNNNKISVYELDQLRIRNPNKNISKNPYSEQIKSLSDKHYETLYTNINLLKSNAQFSDLGDFYLAVLSYFDFNDDLSDYRKDHSQFAKTLWQLYRLGNKYAVAFFDHFYSESQ